MAPPVMTTAMPMSQDKMMKTTPIGPYSLLLDTIDGENSSLLKTPSPVRPIAVNTAVGRSCRHGTLPSVSSRPLTQMNSTNPAKTRTP